MGTNVYMPDFLVGNCARHSRVGLVGIRARDADLASGGAQFAWRGDVAPGSGGGYLDTCHPAGRECRLGRVRRGFRVSAPWRGASVELAASAQGPSTRDRPGDTSRGPGTRATRAGVSRAHGLGCGLPFQQSQLPAAGHPDLREFGSLERRCRQTSGAEFPGRPGRRITRGRSPRPAGLVRIRHRPEEFGAELALSREVSAGPGDLFRLPSRRGPRAGPSGRRPTPVLVLAGTAARPRPRHVAPISGGDYLDTRRPADGE
jgi:hypothetical protein